MATGAAPTYDFAIVTQTGLRADRLGATLSELKGDYDKQLPNIELFGRSGSHEIVGVFRFSFSAYCSALRLRMARKAEALNGKLLELPTLPEAERKRFFEQYLHGFDVHLDAS